LLQCRKASQPREKQRDNRTDTHDRARQLTLRQVEHLYSALAALVDMGTLPMQLSS
jgi:hypothetical protein